MRTAHSRAFAFVCALTVGVACAGSSEASSAAVGTLAPNYAAVDLGGAATSLSALRGKVVVLNQWATWCEPCREEIPQLEALHRQYAGHGLTMIGVSVDAFGLGADVRDFAREHEMTYPVWLDPDKKIAVGFLTVGVPATILIDRGGIIRWRKMGAIAAGDTTLGAAIRAALGS
jgi:cytochrome c biogenesis protein CcmG/thiol:disulfide interchange protein DsbE